MKIKIGKKLSYWIFLLILFFAIFLRFQGIITNSFPFTYDIGRDLIAAREIANLEKFPLIGQTTGLPGLFYGPTWHYILALVYKPLLGDPQIITGFISSSGILMVIIAFFLGKKIGLLPFAFIWSSFLAVSPAVIALTSQIWNPDLIPIFWILSFLSLYKIYNKKNILINLFLLGVFLSIIIDLEIVVGLLYTLGILLSLILLQRKTISVKNAAVFIFGFFIVIFPRIVFDIRHNNILSKTLFNGVVQMFTKGGESVSSTSLPQKISALFSVWSDTFTLGNPYLGAVLVIFTAFMTIYLFGKIKGLTSYFLKITLLTLFISAIGIFLFGHDIWDHYFVLFPLLYVTWVSLVLTSIFPFKKYRNFALILAAAIVIVNCNFPQIYRSFTTPLWEGDAAVYRNQIASVDYIYEKANGRSFKVVVYTPPVYDYTYQYLFSWYGEKKYGKVPDNNSKLFFLILEPDFAYPERLKDWLKIREGDGRIVEEARLKGGIIVQTREVD